jgi:hypothetical protein
MLERRGIAASSLSGLLSQIERFIRRYVVLTEEQAAAVVLWIAQCSRSPP